MSNKRQIIVKLKEKESQVLLIGLTKQELNKVNNLLEHGDVQLAATKLEVSRETVYTALKGKNKRIDIIRFLVNNAEKRQAKRQADKQQVTDKLCQS